MRRNIKTKRGRVAPYTHYPRGFVTQLTALFFGVLTFVSSIFIPHTKPHPAAVAAFPHIQTTLTNPALREAKPREVAPSTLHILGVATGTPPVINQQLTQLTIVTQDSVNHQFDAWMEVVHKLIANGGSSGYQANPAVAALGNSSGGSVINNYSISQRIDKLDGVTITNSSINGASDFSSLGSLDGVGTWFTPTTFGSQNANATSTLIGFESGVYSLASSTLSNLTSINSTSTNSTSTNLFTSNFSLGSLTGFLKATAGVVTSALVDLASNVTGILPVANGGTGWAAIQSGTIPYGNGANQLATSSALTFDGTKLTATYASTTALTTSGSAYLAIGGGNVGVGIAAPLYALDIATSSIGTSNTLIRLRNSQSSGSNGGAAIQLDGYYPGARLRGYTPNATSFTGGQFDIQVNNDSNVLTTAMTIDKSGNVGIGTTIPEATLHIVNSQNKHKLYITGYGNALGNGIVLKPANDTAGAITFQNSAGTTVGSVSTNASATTYNTSSDRRIKENVDYTKLGLDTLMQLPVRDFSFITDETHATTSGFIAQELYEVFPWAVTTNGDNGIDPLTGSSTPWSVDYGRITPLLTKAIQDIASLSTTFKNTLIAWFANSTNGITSFFADTITATVGDYDELNTNKLCVGDVCVTQEEFRALLLQKESASPAFVTPAPEPEAAPSELMPEEAGAATTLPEASSSEEASTTSQSETL